MRAVICRDDGDLTLVVKRTDVAILATSLRGEIDRFTYRGKPPPADVLRLRKILDDLARQEPTADDEPLAIDLNPSDDSAMRLLSIADAAARLHVSERTIERRIRSGELPTTRIGRCRRIRPEALDALPQSGATK